MEAPSTDGPKQLPPCTEIQKLIWAHSATTGQSFCPQQNMTGFTYIEDAGFIRCNIKTHGLFAFFTVTKKTCRHSRHKKKKHMNNIVRPRQTGKREQLHICTCITPGDFIKDGVPKIWTKARPKKNVMFSSVWAHFKEKNKPVRQYPVKQNLLKCLSCSVWNNVYGFTHKSVHCSQSCLTH